MKQMNERRVAKEIYRANVGTIGIARPRIMLSDQAENVRRSPGERSDTDGFV